jgi:hypothetical protein
LVYGEEESTEAEESLYTSDTELTTEGGDISSVELTGQNSTLPREGLAHDGTHQSSVSTYYRITTM